MEIQIDNQFIKIANRKTIIKIINPGYPTFKHEYNFDLREFPSVADDLYENDYPSYWWLGTLYNELKTKTKKEMNTKQLAGMLNDNESLQITITKKGEYSLTIIDNAAIEKVNDAKKKASVPKKDKTVLTPDNHHVDPVKGNVAEVLPAELENKKTVFKHTINEGKRLMDERNYAGAEASYKQAVELFPDDESAKAELAKAGKWVKAMAEL